MILISHRGNISGPEPSSENHPDYIKEALRLGYDCELDVWYKNDEWWLGHDEPLYSIDKAVLQNPKLWCHAKNVDALSAMLSNNIHCFWHQQDNYTLTSKGYIWTYPNKPLTKMSIAVCFDDTSLSLLDHDITGICADHIIQYIKGR